MIISVVHIKGLIQFNILVQMLSTSKLSTYSLAQPKTNEKLFKKHRFASHMVSRFEQEKQLLCSNVAQLKAKYPTFDPDYIKSLLEQLENNIDMVAEILDEEQKKNLKNTMEQQRNQNQLHLLEGRKQKLSAGGSKVEEVKMLMNSITKLFNKLKAEKAQKEQLARKLASVSKENENLKLMNQQLLNEQMQQSSLIRSEDIY